MFEVYFHLDRETCKIEKDILSLFVFRVKRHTAVKQNFRVQRAEFQFDCD